jgi:predicted RND superfamily exporter protein
MNSLATDIQSKDSRVTGAQSLASIMATGATNPDFSAPAIHDALTATPPDILKTAISPDHRSAALSLTIREDVKLLDQKGIIDEVAESNVHPPEGVVMTPAGLGVLGIDAETRLTSHRLSMTVLALLAVLVLLLAVTRNVVYTLLVVGPVAMVIGWTSAAMYLFRVPLNPLTSVAGPLVVALGTEFGILLMLRYREERQRGLPPASAMGQAYILSGRAIAASALTVTGAFLALAFHPFPLLAEFGRVAVIGVALSFAGAMLLMPPLLIWADETLSPVGEEAHNPR